MQEQVAATDVAGRDICGAICRSLVSLKVAVFPHIYLEPLISRVFGGGADSDFRSPNGRGADPAGVRTMSVDSRMRWTCASEIDHQVFDEDDWRDWIDDVAFDEATPLGLFLTNVNPVESLRSRFEVRPGVLSVSAGGRTYVLVTFWHVQSDAEALSRLAVARCLLAH